MFGKLFIYLSLFSGLLTILSYVRVTRGDKKSLAMARRGLFTSGFAILAASIFLLKDILFHNFENGYVWSYSSKSLPLHFLFSAFYAGQEGSFLFWALCSALLSFALFRYTRTRNLEAHVLSVFIAVQTFLVLLLVAKSPFKTIYEMFPGELIAGQLPQDGRGLNPLLQNFWMVIHPPILFIGFAAMAVPFSFAIAALWRKEYSTWLSSALPWVLFSGFTLGAGLMLGAYWAYGVLGWGGYWGWDPVENSSLIPWLMSMALLHTMLVQHRTGHMVRTNFIFAILSFVLVLYSTFLTRSGVLGDSSVHSFTDPGTIVYGMLLAFLLGSTLLGFGFMFVRRKELHAIAKPMNWRTREFALTIGSFVLLASSVIIFFGTSLPIASTTRVEPSFYDMMNFPIAVFITLLIGYSLLVKWEEEDFTMLGGKSWKSLIAAFITTIFIAVFSSFNAMNMLFIFASLFALFVNLEIAYLTSRGNFRMMGGKIAHIGLAVFLVGVLLNGKYNDKKNAILELNLPQDIFGYTLTYTGSHPTDGDKTAFTVSVQKDGKIFILEPVMFETPEQGVMKNPDILSFATKDLYLSPVGIEQSQMGNDGTLSINKGESANVNGVSVTFIKFDMGEHGMSQMGGGGMKVGAVLEISSAAQKETVTPFVLFGEKEPKYFPAESKLLGKIQMLTMNVGGMGEAKSSVQLSLLQNSTQHQSPKEALVVEASIKPFISLVWIGTALLLVGFVVSIFRRKRADAA